MFKRFRESGISAHNGQCLCLCITLQLPSKLTISYVEGNHQSGSVKGDGVEIECRHRGKYRVSDRVGDAL